VIFLEALWHSVEDMAHGLGWIVLGILAGAVLSVLAERLWGRMVSEHPDHLPNPVDELHDWEANPDFEEALWSRGPLPHPSEERVS